MSAPRWWCLWCRLYLDKIRVIVDSPYRRNIANAASRCGIRLSLKIAVSFWFLRVKLILCE